MSGGTYCLHDSDVVIYVLWLVKMSQCKKSDIIVNIKASGGISDKNSYVVYQQFHMYALVVVFISLDD